MKRFFIVILCIIVLSVWVSCDDAHEHQWKEEWEYKMELDSENSYMYHWHACADCPAVTQKEEHKWEYDEDTTDELEPNERKKHCTVCGASIIEKNIGTLEYRGYISTKEEWDAALNMETFPSVIKQHVYYPADLVPNENFIYLSVVEIAENVVYCYDLDDTATYESSQRCYVNEGDSYFCYRFTKQNDEWGWFKEESTKESYHHNMTNYVTIGEVSFAEFFRYEDFSYNISKNAYTCDQIKINVYDEELTVYNIVLTFEDGKLIDYYFEAEVDGYNCFHTTISYDSSEVKIPQYTE